jgi:arginase
MAINQKNVLRLNLPLWQGGDRPAYRLGGQVLAAIAPEPQGPVETIAVPRPGEGVRDIKGGIVWREALLDQLHASRSAILRHNPGTIPRRSYLRGRLLHRSPTDCIFERTVWRRSRGALG